MNRHTSVLKIIPGALAALLLSLGLFYLIMQPPMADLTVMTRLMSLTTFLSILAVYGAHRLGWIARLPRLRWSLLAGSVISAILIFSNILVIAKLMFASQHDLQLAAILLVFATGIAASVNYFLSETLTERIQSLCQAARRIAAGELCERVEMNGQDEMADLASQFNDMADRLEQARQQQEELDTLRRDLVAWVSHDLRTPLTSIRAILEALADGVVDDPVTVQRYLKTAKQDVRSLTTLIDDLFTLSQFYPRQGTEPNQGMDIGGLKINIQPNSMNDLVSDTIESFSLFAESQGVQLTGRVADGVDPVMMDVSLLGRALSNLVSNALRHTPDNGRVNIEVSKNDDHVLLWVEDTGEGIQPEDLPFIFDQFYRAEKSRSRRSGGSGLGLAIAKGMIEAQNGELLVESEPGISTKFTILLPRSNLASHRSK